MFDIFLFKLITTIKYSILSSQLLLLIMFLALGFTIYMGTAENAVQSVFSLILVFAVSSVLVLAAGGEFLAVIILIVYIGAVVVFFLFVGMMVNFNEKLDYTSYFYFKFAAFSSMYWLLVYKLRILELGFSYTFKPNCTKLANLTGISEATTPISLMELINNISGVGNVLYSHFVVAFLYSGMILLVAIFGCVSVSMETKKLNRYNQNSLDQLLKVSIVDRYLNDEKRREEG